jgi:hypothetical protein
MQAYAVLAELVPGDRGWCAMLDDTNQHVVEDAIWHTVHRAVLVSGECWLDVVNSLISGKDL